MISKGLQLAEYSGIAILIVWTQIYCKCMIKYWHLMKMKVKYLLVIAGCANQQLTLEVPNNSWHNSQQHTSVTTIQWWQQLNLCSSNTGVYHKAIPSAKIKSLFQDEVKCNTQFMFYLILQWYFWWWLHVLECLYHNLYHYCCTFQDNIYRLKDCARSSSCSSFALI